MSITTGPLTNAQAGVPFLASLAATGGTQPYHWSLATGTLPAGLSLDPSTGQLSGTTTHGGTFDFSAQVSDSSATKPQTAMKALTLSVLAFALQISPGALPAGQVGIPYQATITGNGGITPYNWAITGALPPGLAIDASSGAVSGTPTQAGATSFTVDLTDSTGQSAHASSSITIAAKGQANAPVIGPAIPVVNQGASLTFTCTANCGTGGTWSVSGTDSRGNPATAAGSIDPATGVYTAPSRVTAQQSYGGYQLLPNNHIFNTRIDSLPVSSGGSKLTIAASPTGAVRKSGTATITLKPAIQLAVGTPVTVSGVADTSFDGTVTVLSWGCGNTCFTYANAGPDATSGGGTMFVPYASAMGSIGMNYLLDIPVNYVDGSTPTVDEIFHYTPANKGPFQIPAYPGQRIQCGYFSLVTVCDKHLWTIDETDGMFQEVYGPTAPGGIPSCPTCTAGSGVRYSPSQYVLPPGGVTAAGNVMMPLTLKLQEVENAIATGGTVNHAISVTVANGYIKSGGVYVWPATTPDYVGGGIVPLGTRFRLKSSFDISAYDAVQQVALKQLQQYGVILTDGGYGWQSGIEASPWPQQWLKDFNGLKIHPQDFEAVDESSLEMSPTSGETTANREIVTYTSSTGAASVDVALQAVTVNMAHDNVDFMAGAAAEQLVAYVHGGAN
ncbi:MAG: Ig domain-containing protein, partial [Candidatus Acidiferrales bacterium]